MTEEKIEITKPDIEKSPPLFTKKQLVSSKKYQNRKDALNILLDENNSYSFEETDRILNNFLKGKVK